MALHHGRCAGGERLGPEACPAQAAALWCANTHGEGYVSASIRSGDGWLSWRDGRLGVDERGGQGLGGPAQSWQHYQLEPVVFVPAQYPDTVPVPEGIDIIRLAGAQRCALSMSDLGRPICCEEAGPVRRGYARLLRTMLPSIPHHSCPVVHGSTLCGGRVPVTFGADERCSESAGALLRHR